MSPATRPLRRLAGSLAHSAGAGTVPTPPLSDQLTRPTSHRSTLAGDATAASRPRGIGLVARHVSSIDWRRGPIVARCPPSTCRSARPCW